MTSFAPLDDILKMDFSQMRALPSDSGRRASDEAIRQFVHNFHLFFSQFKTPLASHPSIEDLSNYQRFLTKLLNKINESEIPYYKQKYINEGFPEQEATAISLIHRLTSFSKIPGLMQYWAASPVWGDPIRNAKEHVAVVRAMESWEQLLLTHHTLITSYQEIINRQRFFTKPKEEEVKEPAKLVTNDEYKEPPVSPS